MLPITNLIIAIHYKVFISEYNKIQFASLHFRLGLEIDIIFNEKT